MARFRAGRRGGRSANTGGGGSSPPAAAAQPALAATGAVSAAEPARLGRLQDGLAALPLWRLRAAFDAAQTTDLNRRHWQDADDLSADDAANPEIRKALRVRARHEIQNNSIARGITLTLANDVIGTGPRLQLLTKDDKVNRQIEHDFTAWASAINLAEKLRTLRLARIQDGEAFALLWRTKVPDTPVRLDVQLIEADQVASPYGIGFDSKNVDGVILDDRGRPRQYQVLVAHPGSSAASFDYVPYHARDVIHVYRADRPGQHRGIPEITAALPLFAQLRRFTLAVLSAAEAAADFAGILYTDAPAGGEADAIEAMDKIDLHRNSLVTMPGGWKMAQLDPKQPATTYAEFKREILNEIARCINMPFNVAAGNSSGYNYASGRLDHQSYFKSLRVDQHFTAVRILDRLLHAWLVEYLATTDILPATSVLLNTPYSLPHYWMWDGMEHVDPLKEANAAAVRLAYGISSIPEEQSRRGVDYETSACAAAKSLGVTVAQYRALVRQKMFGTADLPVVDDDEMPNPEEEETYA